MGHQCLRRSRTLVKPGVGVDQWDAKRFFIEVEVRGDLEYAIRQLKKKLQIDGIKRELKRREYYEKPSVKKRRKQAEARRKLRKFNRMKKAS